MTDDDIKHDDDLPPGVVAELIEYGWTWDGDQWRCPSAEPVASPAPQPAPPPDAVAAMRLALDALESCTPADTSTGHVCWPSFDESAVDAAIDALREVLKAEEPKR